MGLWRDQNELPHANRNIVVQLFNPSTPPPLASSDPRMLSYIGQHDTGIDTHQMLLRPSQSSHELLPVKPDRIKEYARARYSPRMFVSRAPAARL